MTTPRKPGAFDTCPGLPPTGGRSRQRKCGKRKRSIKAYCRDCNAVLARREQTREQAYLRRQQAEITRTRATGADYYFEHALALSVVNGHDVTLHEDADDDTWVGQCAKCLRYLCVDVLAEGVDGTPTPIYGRVHDGLCPGAPDVPAAERKSEYQLAAARSGGTEPATRPMVNYSEIAQSEVLS